MSTVLPRKLAFVVPRTVNDDVVAVTLKLFKGEEEVYAEGYALSELAAPTDTDEGKEYILDIAPGTTLEGTFTLRLWLLDGYQNESEVAAELVNVEIDYVRPPTPVRLRLVK